MNGIDPVVITQLIVAVTTLVTALAAFLKSATNSKKLDQNTSITKVVQTQTNGRMDALTQKVEEMHAAFRQAQGDGKQVFINQQENSK